METNVTNPLIVASNRVPMVHHEGGAQGGLAVGLLAALHKAGGLWLGWNGTVDNETAGHPEMQHADGVSFLTFPLSRKDHREYYVGFSNGMLWPLFHYRLNLLSYDRKDREGYLRVNRLFAHRVKALVEPGTRIWVHDYHLFPLGYSLRNIGVDVPIGFFLHIPFPPWDLLRVLPDYEEFLHFLSHYDLVGLQTRIDLHNFIDCMVQGIGARTTNEPGLLHVAGHRVRAGAFPISIDVNSVQHSAVDGARSHRGQRLARSIRARPLIIGVDRLDYSKGLHERFLAFERLLERNKDYQGQVNFIQIAPHSRTDVPEYAEIRETLERATGHINGRFAHYDWTPLRYLNRGYDRRSILGFLRMGRVALITPLRDGMNLVAKEFVAAQDPDDPGVLVLSHLAGASSELEGALVCNPYDVDGVADRLEEALRMPLTERRERWERNMAVLRGNDIHHWSRSFLKALG